MVRAFIDISERNVYYDKKKMPHENIRLTGELKKTIEKLCRELSTAGKTLLEIKEAIVNDGKPDFSNIEDGEHFFYHGIEFVRLGEEQGGVLCITARMAGTARFDEDNDNDWRCSSLRDKINSEFLPLLNEKDLLPFEMDLVADNGDTAYGTSTELVGIISCDLYRKYRDFIPHYDDWVWTCTPWTCDGHIVRLVYTGGSLIYSDASGSHGFAPVCIFRQE